MPNSKPTYRPSDWTRNDILYLVQQVDQGKYVLVADQRLGLPHINMHFPAEVKHAGMGLMFVETPAYKLTFDAGGAMQKTEPSGHGWSELRVVEGTYPLDLAGLRTQLIELLTLPVEPAQAQAATIPAVDEPPTTPRPAPVEATVAPEPVAVQAGQEPIQTSITKPVVTATLPPEPVPVEAATADFQTVELPEDNGEASSEDESEGGEDAGEGESAADNKPAAAVVKKTGYQAPPPPVNHVTQAPYTWEKCLRTVTIAYLPVKDGEGQQMLVGVRTHEDPWKVRLFNEPDAPLPAAILAMLEEIKAEMPMKAMQALEKATKEKVKKKPVAAIKPPAPASAPSVTAPKAGGAVATGTAPTGAQLDLFSMLAGG